ncbi:MAG: iron-sulfur cluster assembly scaffold protein [Planctomycetes bacterium]|nr:iron-sulfur cluster assembly scaffold protein [Planctomycetota bacterium]
MAGLPEPLLSHRKALAPGPPRPLVSTGGVGENAACGDRIELWLAPEGERVRCGYAGRGCGAALALASFTAAALDGTARERLGTFDLRGEVERMGGLGRTQHHALELVLRALEQAREELERGYPLAR